MRICGVSVNQLLAYGCNSSQIKPSCITHKKHNTTGTILHINVMLQWPFWKATYWEQIKITEGATKVQ